MYATGEGIEQSFTTAKEWLQKAAAQGHEDAIAALKQVDKDIKRTTTLCQAMRSFESGSSPNISGSATISASVSKSPN